MPNFIGIAKFSIFKSSDFDTFTSDWDILGHVKREFLNAMHQLFFNEKKRQASRVSIV